MSMSDEEAKEFTEKLEKKNTKKISLFDIKVFKECLDACDEKRAVEDITPVELQEKTVKITVSSLTRDIVLATRTQNSYLLATV